MHHDQKSITIYNAQDLTPKMRELYEWCKAMSIAGHKLIISAVDEKTKRQENVYHSCFSDFAKSALFAGERIDEEAWKRALLYAFYIATKDDPDYKKDWESRKPRLIRSLDGLDLLQIGIESKKFTRRLAIAFITFVHSEGDARGVIWSPTSIAMDMEP
jgi:NinB protein